MPETTRHPASALPPRVCPLERARPLFKLRSLSTLRAMTFPLFLGILFGAMATVATLTYLFSRGDSGHH